MDRPIGEEVLDRVPVDPADVFYQILVHSHPALVSLKREVKIAELWLQCQKIKALQSTANQFFTQVNEIKIVTCESEHAKQISID